MVFRGLLCFLGAFLRLRVYILELLAGIIRATAENKLTILPKTRI